MLLSQVPGAASDRISTVRAAKTLASFLLACERICELSSDAHLAASKVLYPNRAEIDAAIQALRDGQAAIAEGLLHHGVVVSTDSPIYDYITNINHRIRLLQENHASRAA